MRTRTCLTLLIITLITLPALGVDASRIEGMMQHAQRLAASGRFDQASSVYRTVLHIEPDHAKAYRNIWKIDQALGVAENPTQKNRLANAFGEGFFLKQSDHYLIVYDGRHSWADSRARMLELAYDQFYKQMRRVGFRPLPPERHLECIMFNTHDAYLNYARDVDRIGHDWSSGYYSTRSNRVAFFNIHYSPQLKEQVVNLQKLENEVQRLIGEAANDPRQNGRLNAARANLSAHRRAYERSAAFGNIQQTIHEAAHQIAFNSGIQTRASAYPMWFSEGLATCFETIAPAAPFGPEYDNAYRRKILVKAIKSKKVMPLADFARLQSPPEDKEARENAYAQSWGLYHFLYNERPEQLVAYTRAYFQTPVRNDEANRFGQLFVEHFGPIREVEQAYKAYVLAM